MSDVATAGGHPVTAVDGFPADSVNWALDGGLETPPDLVISGSNEGQNYSVDFVPISGTVGAAATAARSGVPAIALSQGLPEEGQAPDFDASVDALDSYLAATLDTYRGGAAPLLVSINVPTCPPGDGSFEMLVAPPATDFGDRAPLAPARCDGPLPGLARDDVHAFNHGHPVLSELDPETLDGVEYTGPMPD